MKFVYEVTVEYEEDNPDSTDQKIDAQSLGQALEDEARNHVENALALPSGLVDVSVSSK